MGPTSKSADGLRRTCRDGLHRISRPLGRWCYQQGGALARKLKNLSDHLGGAIIVVSRLYPDRLSVKSASIEGRAIKAGRHRQYLTGTTN